MAAGINFREGKKGSDFADYNPFLPHYVDKPRLGEKRVLNFKGTVNQEDLRNKLYKTYDKTIYNMG